MKLEFTAYSVLKNEDADPFVGDNFLVVADGLGGSGSTVHNIKQNDNYQEQLINAALTGIELDEEDDEYCSYLDSLFNPMIDENPDTSALWASRIVIARYVYALKNNMFDIKSENSRAEFSKFIKDGLMAVGCTFNLEKGEYDALKLLPTTMASIIYNEDEKSDEVEVNTVWAGDSRCYAITSDGLKVLSIDHEDSAELVTNIFYASPDNKTAKLDIRTYKLKKPFILIACSDGIFDPFAPLDNLTVENVFLENIFNSKDIDELKNSLESFYNNVRTDDASIAFKAVGFNEYNDIKDFVKDRYEYNKKLYEDYKANKEAFSLLDLKEDDVLSYVKTRTKDVYPKISKLLIQDINNGTIPDSFIKYIMKDFDKFKAEYINKQKSDKKSNFKNTLLNNRLFCKQLVDTFDPKAVSSDRLDAYKVKKDLSQNLSGFTDPSDKAKRENGLKMAIEGKKQDFKVQYEKEINALSQDVKYALSNNDFNTFEKDICDKVSELKQYINYLYYGNTFKTIYNPKYRELYNAVDFIIDQNSQIKTLRGEIEKINEKNKKNIKEYEILIGDFINLFFENDKNIDILLSYTGSSGINEEKRDAEIKKKLFDTYVASLNNGPTNDNIDLIVSLLKDRSYSGIITCYTPIRVESFRNYYEINDNLEYKNKLLNIKKDIEENEIGYNKYISDKC